MNRRPGVKDHPAGEHLREFDAALSGIGDFFLECVRSAAAGDEAPYRSSFISVLEDDRKY